MAKRTLSLLLVGMLTIGGMAGCSSKKHNNDTTTTTTATTGGSGSSGSNGGGGSGSASDKVKAYCDSVDAFVTKAKKVMADPTSGGKVSELSTEATNLASKAQALATGLTADEAKQVSDCSAKASKALTPGG